MPVHCATSARDAGPNAARYRRTRCAAAASPDAPSAPSHVRAGTNVPPDVCERQTEDCGPLTRPAWADSPYQTSHGRRSSICSFGRPSSARSSGRGTRLLGRERRQALSVLGEVGLLAQRGQLSLELPDPARAIDAGEREVVRRADEVERRAHERCFHDTPTCHRAHEVVGREPVDARPQTDVRRRRPLRLDARHALDGLGDREPVSPEEELSRERRPIQLSESERPHGATIVGARVCRHFRCRGEPGPPDADPARRPPARVRGLARGRSRVGGDVAAARSPLPRVSPSRSPRPGPWTSHSSVTAGSSACSESSRRADRPPRSRSGSSRRARRRPSVVRVSAPPFRSARACARCAPTPRRGSRASRARRSGRARRRRSACGSGRSPPRSRLTGRRRSRCSPRRGAS